MQIFMIYKLEGVGEWLISWRARLPWDTGEMGYMNLMKFSKDKCKDLHLGLCNAMHQDRQGPTG